MADVGGWDAWRNHLKKNHIQTITFHYPKEFRKAVAASLGRVGDTASLGETEAFIREAVRLNIEALMKEHCNRPSSLRARLSSRGRMPLKARVAKR